jgi:hypothetical protein
MKIALPCCSLCMLMFIFDTFTYLLLARIKEYIRIRM